MLRAAGTRAGVYGGDAALQARKAAALFRAAGVVGKGVAAARTPGGRLHERDCGPAVVERGAGEDHAVVGDRRARLAAAPAFAAAFAVILAVTIAISRQVGEVFFEGASGQEFEAAGFILAGSDFGAADSAARAALRAWIAVESMLECPAGDISAQDSCSADAISEAVNSANARKTVDKPRVKRFSMRLPLFA